MGSINLFEGLSFLSLVLDWVIGWLLVFWGLFNCFYSPVYFFFDLEFLTSVEDSGGRSSGSTTLSFDFVFYLFAWSYMAFLRHTYTIRQTIKRHKGMLMPRISGQLVEPSSAVSFAKYFSYETFPFSHFDKAEFYMHVFQSLHFPGHSWTGTPLEVNPSKWKQAVPSK